MTNSVLTVFEDIGKVIAWPFVHVSRTISILTTTLKDYPAVRTAVVGLVQECGTVAADVEAAAAAAGTNIPADATALAAGQALYTYVTKTFLPAVEAAYKDEVSAATTDAAAAAATAAARSAAAKKAAATRTGTVTPAPAVTSNNVTQPPAKPPATETSAAGSS